MKSIVAFLVSSAVACATPALAATGGNLLNNGDFSTAATDNTSQGNNNFQISTGEFYGSMDGSRDGTANNWYSDASKSYNLLFNTSNAATQAGSAYSYYSNPNTAGGTWNQQYLKSLAATTNGVGAVGNFVALDGDSNFSNRSLNQFVAGLVNGQQYTLAFDWATGALASGGIDATSAGADITLGGLNLVSVNSTSVPTAGWARSSTTFTYTGTNAGSLLSFIAKGTPNGAPPMFLLDNVSLTAAVPEPATWAMMLVGFGAIGFGMRRKRTTGVSFA